MPSAQGLLDLVDDCPLGSMGGLARVVYMCGEFSHVTDNPETDCVGALGALNACLHFLVYLEERRSG